VTDPRASGRHEHAAATLPLVPSLEIRSGVHGKPVVALVRGLLDCEELAGLRASTRDLERTFIDASIEGLREDWRVASVVYDPPASAKRVAARVAEIALHAARALDVTLDTIADVECQMTVSGHGGVYKRHSDSQGPDAKKRVLSYVHYFVADIDGTKRFEGGELWLYEGAGEPLVVVPEDNLTVLFASHLEHEIRPVRVPTGLFAHGRFTVNGWVWRP